MKDIKEINQEGLLSLISKLDYKAGEVDEMRVAGSLVISIIHLALQDDVYDGKRGLDLNKRQESLEGSISCGTYLEPDQIKKLVDSLKSKILSFDTPEVRFVDKGTFVVKKDQTLFFKDQDLYRRNIQGYQPDVTAEELDESNPPSGGSGFIPAKS